MLTTSGRLKAVGKSLPDSKIDGESIGLMAFRAQGVAAFRSALETAVRDPETLSCFTGEPSGRQQRATCDVVAIRSTRQKTQLAKLRRL